MLVDQIIKENEGFLRIVPSDKERKKIERRCRKRCQRKGFKGQEYRDALYQCIFGELIDFKNRSGVYRERPKTDEEEHFEVLDREIRGRRVSRRTLDIWGKEEPKETSKDIEREFNKNIRENFRFCSRCGCNPCICREEEE